jgi:hypothetical protein
VPTHKHTHCAELVANSDALLEVGLGAMGAREDISAPGTA